MDDFEFFRQITSIEVITSVVLFFLVGHSALLAEPNARERDLGRASRPNLVAMPRRASMRVAQERAAKKRLQRYDEDERGIDILESARPYKLTSSHRDIGGQSTGLALYFDTIMHFALLMAVLFALVGVFPLYHNLTTVELDTRYEVMRVNRETGVTFIQSCDKAGDAGSRPSFILASSLGSDCSDPLVASFYNCPTQCFVEADTPDSEDFCAAHLPCGLSAVAEEEAASCCEESLRDSLVDEVHAPRWILSLTAMAIILVWTLHYHKQQLITAQEINARSVTVGDYAVAVRGLETASEETVTRDELAAHMAHYGEVASVVFTKNIGTLLFVENQLASLQMRLAEAKAWATDAGAGRDGFSASLFKSAAGLGRADAAAVARLEARVRATRAAAARLSRRPVANLGEAFVTFNYEQHAKQCFDDHDRGGASALGRCLANAFPDRFGAPPRFRGRALRCEPPPEPCDVTWANFDVRGNERVRRGVVAFAAMLLCIGAGAGLQYQFESLRESVRVEQYDEELVAAAGNVESSLSFADKAYASALTALSSFVIVAVNMFLTTVAKAVTRYQRFYTMSEFEASLMLKLTIVHVLNSIVVPAASSRCERGADDRGQCLWFAPGGLAESAFFLQIFNAFVPDVIALLDASGRLRRSVLSRYARTQQMLDAMLDPDEFILAEKYSQVCKTIALALVYGPILPLSYAIALIGLCSSYWTDKYLALRRFAKPARQRDQATYRVVLFMNSMALLQLAAGYVFYDYHQPLVYAAAAGAWFLFQAFPVSALCGVSRDEAMEDGGTGGVSYWENMGKTKGSGNGWTADAKAARRAVSNGSARTRSDDSLTEKSEALDEEDAAKRARARNVECALLDVPESEHDVGRLETYHPPVPESAAEDFAAMIVEAYRLPAEVTPGNPTLLENQKPQTGGPNRVDPPMTRDAQNLAAMQELDRNHGVAFAAATPGTLTRRG